MKRRDFITIIKIWVPLAIVTTLLCGLIFVGVQQNYRMSANDPQIQLAQDLSDKLASGQNPRAFIPRSKIDMSHTLAAFILIFDKDAKLIGSSVAIDGLTPAVPSGVFVNTKKLKETRFTWEPKPGVRSALVMDYYSSSNASGFVAIGRSLKEVEIREDNLEKIVAAAWIITLLSSFLSIYFLQKLK